VADEVRNLAMRAAEAAKNTANLIEGTVTKVKSGSELVDKTGEAFMRVTQSSNKVKELVAEIAAASSEQSQGVDQINKAVSEMNQVTQQVAANSEESASAAEELNAQAEQMKGIVSELAAIVGGAAERGNGHRWQLTPKRFLKGKAEGPPAAVPQPDRGKKLLAHQKEQRQVTPRQVIPLECEQFTDF